jgi:hypothetical protein
MEYVLKTKNWRGEEMYFEKLSTLGCPIDDKHLVCAKRFTLAKALKMCGRLNSLIRTLPNFTENWLYKVVACA